MPLLQNEYETIDDVMVDVISQLLVLPVDSSPSRGPTSEIIGAAFKLTNPLARLSRSEAKGTIFSALGELCWYLAKSNKLDFITHYIQRYKKESLDKETVYGAYGPRLFNFRGGINQVQNVINYLKEKPDSRKAVIQLFDAADLNSKQPEFPCTCTLQFLVRHGKIHLHVNMRSNDALYGLPHDVFAFTMIQEIVGCTLGLPLGEYFHTAGSLHLYEETFSKAQDYINEGYQPTKAVMQPMPTGDPWESIRVLLDYEDKIRNGGMVDESLLLVDPYWRDLIGLLEIFSAYKRKDFVEMKNQREKVSRVYHQYIDKKLS